MIKIENLCFPETLINSVRGYLENKISMIKIVKKYNLLY